MKDLDFDELDKAVNSLMTSVSKTPSTSNKVEDENTLDIIPTLPENERPPADMPSAITAEATNEADSTEHKIDEATTVVADVVGPTPPATRRGGRFMDVVHPSSDMKKVSTPGRPVSRQGVAIEPADSTHSEVIQPSLSPAPVVNSVGSIEPIKEEAILAGGWPDPLEMTDFKETDTKEADWSPIPSVQISSEPVDDQPAPLTSPFLPDTKVEKRPLGSGVASISDDIDLTPPEEPREDKTVNDPEDQLPAMPSDVPQQLPEELQSDLMSIEADTHMGVPKTEQSHPLDTSKLEDTDTSSGPAVKSSSPSAATGPVSIPQQYREEPSTSDQKSVGIYDTDSYHSPLEHPAKKKAGWMWIIWIVGILLVGAGGGAALFFSGLVG